MVPSRLSISSFEGRLVILRTPIQNSETEKSAAAFDTLKGRKLDIGIGFDAKRSFCSPLVWLIVVLIIFDFFISGVKPLRFVQIPGVVLKDQDPIDFRIEAALNPKRQSNVFFMGTSLVDAAAVNADAIQYGLKLRMYDRDRYMQTRYFDSRLYDRLSLKSQGINVGVGGSMVSGMERILKELFKDTSAKRPALVVLTVAPRAFIHSNRKPELYPVECYFNNRFFKVSDDLSWKENFQNLLKSNWTFFRLKSDYSTVLVKFASAIFDRPETAYENSSIHQIGKKRVMPKLDFRDEVFDPGISARQEWVQSVGQYYRSAYGTQVERPTYSAQKASLARTIKLLDSYSVPVIVVSMPLSEYNRKDLPDGFEQEYKLMLEEVVGSSEGKLIYLLDSPMFSFSDFREGVHLNGLGAKRFWDIVVDQIESDASFLKKLRSRF